MMAINLSGFDPRTYQPLYVDRRVAGRGIAARMGHA